MQRAQRMSTTNPFGVGDQVCVKRGGADRHCRCPGYIQGKTGLVERICGRFPNPEQLAYGGDGLPERTLYRVRFLQKDVWSDYPGANDTIDVELYEHWLTPFRK